ncbi:MAG TPA: hypothetical protein VM715_16990 [Candidatus Acidoferrum sp.]|jgi:hypothetical protein|nr:hypothetical protein [Candidatus Acidoferrum sp.]
MADRITFAQLVNKVQSGRITQKESEQYFAYDSATTKPFDPGIALNENNVDISGVELAARASAYELGVKADKIAKANLITTSARAPKPDGSIIAEGDSWFHLPSWYQKTMITWLQDIYPITDIAHQGDTLEDIMIKGEYQQYLATGKVRILLFSAGGNDFLGSELASCLNQFDVDHTKPSDAAYYITPAFDQILSHCDGYYRLLSSQVQSSKSSRARIVVHGYDHVSPACHGIFIGDKMSTLGLNPCDKKYAPLCNAIIHLMIDRFNNMLANLARFLPNFTYCNLRGTLSAGDFFDELHPKSANARLLANKMAKCMGPSIARARATQRRQPEHV